MGSGSSLVWHCLNPEENFFEIFASNLSGGKLWLVNCTRFHIIGSHEVAFKWKHFKWVIFSFLYPEISFLATPLVHRLSIHRARRCFLSLVWMLAVAYAENFRGEAQVFRHSRVTSQINFRGSAEGTTISKEVRGRAPGKMLQKSRLKIRVFVQSGSKFWTTLFSYFLFLGSEGVAMAQWPPPSVH